MRRPSLRLRTLAALAAVAALLPGTAGAAVSGHHSSKAAPRLHVLSAATRFNAATSNNWFGYNQGFLDKTQRFTSIEGTWNVPTATRHTAGSNVEASSDWIGIGGGCVDSGCGTGVTDQTLIQAGTEQDVDANGNATYDAWWEIIPEPETLTTLAVHPGDQIHVAIAESVPGLWNIELDNVTTGQKFTTSTPYPALGGSAEWIEETPLLLGTDAGFSALPNLTTVQFSGAKVNGANANLQPVSELDLADSNGSVYSVPSAPNSTHDGFNACAWSTTCQ